MGHPTHSFIHLRLGRPEVLSPVGLTVKILKALLPSSIWVHDQPIFIFYIWSPLLYVMNRTHNEVPHCEMIY